MNNGNGIQETVRLGLIQLAENVNAGKYGENDDAFDDEEDAQKFLNDMHDEVLDKME